MVRKIKKQLLIDCIQFLKLQLAGNVLFWGGLAGTWLFLEIFHTSDVFALGAGTFLAYIAFFVIDRNWVFSDETGSRKTSIEVVRFVLFMGANFFINILLVSMCSSLTGLSVYVSQFIVSIFFFTPWSWLGLKFWVFRQGRHARPHALTIETKRTNAKRHDKYQQLKAKQKAKRAA